MEGLIMACLRKLVFEDVKLPKKIKTGGTSYLPVGKAIFYKGKLIINVNKTV